jgi:hypothetical protein
MATVIDELIVKLGLDPTEFEKGAKVIVVQMDQTKKATEKVGKNIAADGKKGAEFFGQLEKAALKFFAVLTAGRGLSDFTRTVIGTGAQLDRMSKVFGTNTDTLSRWQGAVRQSGGTADGFIGTMQGLSSSLTELKLTGTTGILPYLQALGISIADARGKARPLEDILGDIGDKLTKLPNKGDAFNIGKSLGLDEGTINLLLKGRTEVSRLLAAQKGYSDADAEAARKASENWEAAQLRLERTTQLLVIKLIPAFEKLTKAATDLADVSVPMLGDIYNWLEKIDSVTGKWAAKIDSLLPKFKNPALQAIFGGTTGKLITGNPLTNAAGAGEVARNQLSPQARSSIDRARDEVMAFFGSKLAKQRLSQPGNSGPTSNPLDIFELGNPATSTPPPSGASRAQRNNNPGNLEFRGQSGAVPEDGSGRFAKFGSASEGVSALVKQLQRYGNRGLDSLDKIVGKYAPPNENDTQAYIDVLSKKLGVAPSEKLDLNNPVTLADLVKGISRHEAGNDFLSNQDVMTGISMAGVGGSQNSGNVSIGEVKVYTQAQDANGIARDIKGAMIRQADTAIR